jgi:hypothetical protein
MKDLERKKEYIENQQKIQMDKYKFTPKIIPLPPQLPSPPPKIDSFSSSFLINNTNQKTAQQIRKQTPLRKKLREKLESLSVPKIMNEKYIYSKEKEIIVKNEEDEKQIRKEEELEKEKEPIYKILSTVNNMNLSTYKANLKKKELLFPTLPLSSPSTYSSNSGSFGSSDLPSYQNNDSVRSSKENNINSFKSNVNNKEKSKTVSGTSKLDSWFS